MPSLLVKEISADLLREVNYLASKAGQTQREWVIEQLVKQIRRCNAGFESTDDRRRA